MEEVTQPKVYARTCIALLALLALTWTVAYIDLGPFNLIVALAVAIAKAIIIALFFMHIKGSSRLLHLAAVAGVIWLLFLISLTLGDYITRGWVIAIAGVFLQIALGAVYAWSVFRIPLSKQFGWSISQVTFTFTISIFVLGFAAFFGGLWMARKGPRIVALTGAVLYGLGVFL